MKPSQEEFFGALQGLVESWCDRRCCTALRFILKGYPLSSPLTDSWAELLDAMQSVRAFAIDEITDTEKEILNHLIVMVEKIVYR